MIASLHLQLYQARQLYLSQLPAAGSAVCTATRRCLNRLGAGPSEFIPKFEAVPEPSSPARVCYHLAHIATYVSFSDIETATNSRIPSLGEPNATSQHLETWMAANAQGARAVALHSAQILRLVSACPSHGQSRPSPPHSVAPSTDSC